MILKDTAAVITGGASGLGAATARNFRAAGAQVTLFDLDEDRGAALAAEIGAGFVRADVTDDASVTAAVAEAARQMGRITALVCCAGVAPAERTLGRNGPHRLDSFRRTVDINLVGTFNVIRLVSAQMAKNTAEEKGVIIMTASVAAFDGQKGQAAYASSKAAVAGLTLPLARDLAGVGIRVVTIAPGIFATPMLHGLPDEVQSGLAADVTFPKRVGDPAEYAALARFVLECGYLNGEVIRLDGALRMQ